MAERITKEQAEQIIRQTALEAGAGDLADILVATAIAETGLDNYVPGDNGHSWGLFHENDGGRGHGFTKEERQDPKASTLRAIAEFRAEQRKHPDADPGQLAIFAQRPSDKIPGNRERYAARINGIVNDFRASGDPNRNTGTPPPRATSVAASTQQGNYAFPLRGYKGGQIPKHWGSEEKGSEGGADIFAPVGTPVQSMVSGTVQWANTDDSAGGNNVGIIGDDGNTYYYAHMRDAPMVKAGQKVSTGQDLGVVGNTGNAKGTPSHLHIGIGKGIQTGTGSLGGLGKNFDATTLLNQALKGGAGFVPMSNTAGAGGKPKKSEEQIVAEVRDEQNKAIARDAALQGLQGKVQPAEDKWKPYRDRIAAAEKVQADLREQYKNAGGVPPQYEKKPGGFPGTTIDVETEDWKAWTAARRTITQLTGNEGEGELATAYKKAYDDAVEAARKRETEVRDEVETRIRKEAGENAPAMRTQIRGNELINLDNGDVIRTLSPEEQKPGSTFNVPGKGTFIVSADGRSASILTGTETAGNRREVATTDANGKPITLLLEDTPQGVKEIGRYPRVPSASDRNRTQVIESTDANGNTVSKLIDLDDNGRVIQTYTKAGPKENIQPITAPKDAEFISYYDPNTKSVVFEKNKNYQAGSGSTYRDTKTGRVARFDANGKLAEVTDVLTADERKTADRLSQAEIGKAEADNVKTLIDAAKALHDQEMERRTQELWENAQKEAANPNSTAADVVAAIQAGAKNAQEWSQVFQTHINQKTQEETARANRVTESVNIQNADRMTREGLYKDITDTRNQRTLAQAQSNAAIKDSGIIGEANSMNVLAAMAPNTGVDGIRRAGTIGLGVGAGAIEPVQTAYESHLEEIENLRSQMPSVRLANPDAGGKPDFSIPRPKAGSTTTAVANKPNQSSQLGTTLLNKAKGIMENNPIITGVSGTSDVAGGQKPNTGVTMGGSGVSVATGLTADQMAEDERKKAQASGAGGFRPRFKVPKGRKAA